MYSNSDGCLTVILQAWQGSLLEVLTGSGTDGAGNLPAQGTPIRGSGGCAMAAPATAASSSGTSPIPPSDIVHILVCSRNLLHYCRCSFSTAIRTKSAENRSSKQASSTSQPARPMSTSKNNSKKLTLISQLKVVF